MVSLVIKYLSLSFSEAFVLSHSGVEFLTLSRTFFNTVFKLDYCVHKVLALVEVGTHYAKRNVVVQADVGESLVVEQAESIVSADKVSLRVKFNDAVLLKSLYFRMDIKAWLAQKLIAT